MSAAHREGREKRRQLPPLAIWRFGEPPKVMSEVPPMGPQKLEDLDPKGGPREMGSKWQG